MEVLDIPELNNIMGLDIFFKKKKVKEIGYFRKVNFLVKYFEDNCGLDTANQTPLRIHINDIMDLKDRCSEVINNPHKAEELLPTMDGFYFGSSDYDENYLEDVQRVYDYCTYLLSEFDALQEDESIWFEIWY